MATLCAKFQINLNIKTNFTAFLVNCLIWGDNAILRGNDVDFAFAKSLPYYHMCHKTSCIFPNCTILCVSMGESSGSIPAKYWLI